MNHGLPQETVRKIRQVFQQHPEVSRAILYGSRAKGTHHPGSDIDLTLEGDLIDHAAITQITAELDDLLLPYKIDLSAKSTLTHPPLLDHIERLGKVFYCSGNSLT